MLTRVKILIVWEVNLLLIFYFFIYFATASLSSLGRLPWNFGISIWVNFISQVQKSRTCEFGPIQMDFFGRLHFGPYRVLAPQIFTRGSIYAIARICYCPSVRPSLRLSVCLSVCPSVRQVDHRKTVEDRIMKFSPYGSPIPLVFREQV